MDCGNFRFRKNCVEKVFFVQFKNNKCDFMRNFKNFLVNWG